MLQMLTKFLGEADTYTKYNEIFVKINVIDIIMIFRFIFPNYACLHGMVFVSKMLKPKLKSCIENELGGKNNFSKFQFFIAVQFECKNFCYKFL